LVAFSITTLYASKQPILTPFPCKKNLRLKTKNAMARSSLLLPYFSGSSSFRIIFFFIPTTLALFCISTTFYLFTHYHPLDPSFLGLNSPFGSSTFSPLTRQTVSISFHNHSKTPFQLQVPQIVHLGEEGFGSQGPLEP
ncbi:hypothetical protein CFP56_026889, partial [Quercus suber]